ncbi:MerR family DNA-binding protein [Kingella kingae]|uniref:MerR family DNA-binding protein n=1 Tax=Kingella kingae TaxID=504 RepID=UPI00254C5701|nr:MerR family DNA-binding protein [Kingella kingae]MDK4673754.1 MerR family DNA-binding protein [Kingella kingae]
MTTFLQKSELSRRTGLSLETLRYYEKVGLLPEPKRAENGYRLFREDDIILLNFIKKCRSLGFSIDETKQLNDLRQNPQTNCQQADDLVVQHLAIVQEKIQQLTEIQTMLQTMSQCENLDVAHCKVMENLGN